MQTLLILQGPPASGKSTFARELMVKDPTYVKVCRDDFRHHFQANYWMPKHEEWITALEDDSICLSLHHGFNVIVDATNLNQKTLDRIKNLGNVKAGVSEGTLKIEYKMFDTSLEECLERDRYRGEKPGEHCVGEKVIRDFFNRYPPKKELIEPVIERIIQNSELPKAIIIDLDGTLCIHNGRGPYEEHKCDTDLVNHSVREILCNCMETHNIIFLSGRSDAVYQKSYDWIAKHLGVIGPLYMRKTGDSRDDRIVKRELFDMHIKDVYYVDFILDDRNKVVKMWRDMGLTCLQVAEGNF